MFTNHTCLTRLPSHAQQRSQAPCSFDTTHFISNAVENVSGSKCPAASDHPCYWFHTEELMLERIQRCSSPHVKDLLRVTDTLFSWLFDYRSEPYQHPHHRVCSTSMLVAGHITSCNIQPADCRMSCVLVHITSCSSKLADCPTCYLLEKKITLQQLAS